MKNLDRRTFLTYAVQSAAALGLSSTVVGRLEAALATGASGLPAVLWLSGASCTGCTVSLANRVAAQSPVDIGELLTSIIDLDYHTTLMGAAGDLAVETLNSVAGGAYVLAVDGGIPAAFGGAACFLWSENGKDVTAVEAVTRLAPNAAAILAIGTCASFGGVAGARPNSMGVLPLSALTTRPVINIPGCPPHPDWIIATVAELLAGVSPRLDSQRRPYALFGGEGRNVHHNCPRRETEEADRPGIDNQCLKELGCSGPETQGDCPTRLWNGGTNWCVGANAVCLGCTQQGFPDRFSPFWQAEGD
jgi:hydrogenase small subunit